MKEKFLSFIKSKTFHIFLAFLGLCFVAYVGFLNQNYVSDNIGGRVISYDQMSIGEFFNHPIIAGQGRHMSITYWLIHAPLSKLGITYFQNQWVYFAIEMFVMAIALTIIYNVFAKILKTKKFSIALFLAISFIGVNPFMCDALIFLLPSHPQAILFIGLALLFLAKEFRFKNIALAFLFTTLAISTYQNYYALFLILALPLILIINKGKIDKQLFKRVAVVLAIAALSIGAVLLVSKIHCAILGEYNANGTTIHLSLSWLLERAKFILKLYKDALSTSFYLFPPALLLIIPIVTVITLGIALIRNHKIKEFIFILAMTTFVFFSPVYYGMIADIYYTAPRILPALFAVLSICAILLIYYFPKLKDNHLFIAATITIAAIIIYCCNTFIIDMHIDNRIQMAELRLIINRLEKYEKENDTTIKTIVVRHGNGRRVFYKNNIHLYAAENASRDITGTEWSDVSTIQTLTGRTFTKEDLTPEDAIKYFNDFDYENDFAIFDPDVRLKFDGDKMYWMDY